MLSKELTGFLVITAFPAWVFLLIKIAEHDYFTKNNYSASGNILEKIKYKTNKMAVCYKKPETFEQADNRHALSFVSVSKEDFAVDFSKNKITIAKKPNVIVDKTGITRYVALLDTINKKIVHVSQATPALIRSGSTITFDSWDIWISEQSEK